MKGKRNLFSVSPCLRGGRSERGSVLVFAVILIVLLFGIGTAFVLYVRQESRASANALQNVQAGQASDAGLNFTLRNIRNAVLTYSFLTPDGVFDPTKASYLQTDPDPALLGGQPQRNLFRMFEAYPAEPTVAATIANANGHAWLWYHSDAGFFASAGLESAAEPLRFTDAKIAHYATTGGAVKQYFASGPEHAGLARRFVVDLDQGGIAQFYSPKPPTTWKSGQMAEFYVWIADLDGKLNAVPQAWDIDSSLTETSDKTAQAILMQTFKFPGIYASSSATVFNDTDLLNVWNRTTPYGGITDVFANVASSKGYTLPVSGGGAAVYEYYNFRYGIDRYMAVNSDGDESPSTTAADKAAFLAKYGVPFMSVKDHQNGININTANYETVAAVLSRVPLIEPFDPTSASDVAANLTKAQALAARICAKRPFLCRIDFEDFLAAHLDQVVDPTPLSDSSNKEKPAGMIYRAIPKRASNATLATPYTMPSLAELIEIPGVPDTHPDFQVLRDVVMQQARFTWFRKEDSIASVTPALLTVKAFNNLLNSIGGKKRDGTYGYSYYSYDPVKEPVQVTGANPPKFEYSLLKPADVPGTYDLDKPLTGDGALVVWRATKDPTNGGYYEMNFIFSAEQDVQEIAYGDAVPVPPPPVPLISAGTDGVLQTPARTPDDLVVGTEIQDGGNAVCDSWIHGPLRAYRLADDAVATKPTAAINSGALGNGDVSWSPRFAFRSRYFAVYVLSRALDPSGQPYAGSTRRVEAVYDALKDQVIWRRQPVTEKRNLGDPEP